MPKTYRAICVLCLLTVFSTPGIASDPHPENVVDVIVSAYDRYPLVALGERHNVAEMYAFYNALIVDPRFQQQVDCIVLEIANAIHQPILDAYVNGQAVSIEKLHNAWRDATNSLLQDGDALHFDELVTTIRRVNARLEPGKRLRVLAGDPPLDWNTVDKKGFYRALGSRDKHYAEVVTREVLKPEKKGLLIMGRGHLSHMSPNPEHPIASDLIEQNSPGSLFIVHLFTHSGIHAKKCASWPVPSIGIVAGSWLADLSSDVFHRKFNGKKPTLGQTVDAILWLGPKSSFTQIVEPVFDNPVYLKELERRRILLK